MPYTATQTEDGINVTRGLHAMNLVMSRVLRSMKTSEQYTLFPPRSAALHAYQIDRDAMNARDCAQFNEVNGLG